MLDLDVTLAPSLAEVLAHDVPMREAGRGAFDAPGTLIAFGFDFADERRRLEVMRLRQLVARDGGCVVDFAVEIADGRAWAMSVRPHSSGAAWLWTLAWEACRAVGYATGEDSKAAEARARLIVDERRDAVLKAIDDLPAAPDAFFRTMLAKANGGESPVTAISGQTAIVRG